MNYPEFDPEKLKQEQADYEDKKAWLGVAGSIGDSIANTPSFYEIYKGKSLGGPNVKGVTDAISKTMVDPSERQKRTFEQYTQAKEVEKQKLADSETAKLTDPNSTMSKAYKAYAVNKGWVTPEEASSMNAKDILNFGDPKKLREIEAQSQIEFGNQKKLREMDIAARSKEGDLNRANDLAKIQAEMAKKQNEKMDPKNLSGTDKARYDNSLMVLKAIDGMDSALTNGDNTFSMIGDNDFTLNSRDAAEAIGRMQSGGAINLEEEKRFRAMLPTATDSTEMQAKKLEKLRAEMLSRVKTLGIPLENTGYTPTALTYGSGSNTNTAHAKSGPKDGDIKEYNGKVYVVKNGQWIEQKEKVRP